MSNQFLHLVRRGGGAVLVVVLLLAGCQSDDSEKKEKSPPMVAPTEQPSDQKLSPRTLATRYLRYAYRGALLSSDHPLNDSLAMLMAGSVGGRALTIIDTFYVESVQTADSVHTVRTRFPRSVQIQSVTWATSPPTVDAQQSLRIRGNYIRKAPHVVGWPAFQTHLRDVAPEAADSVLTNIGNKLNRPPEAGV